MYIYLVFFSVWDEDIYYYWDVLKEWEKFLKISSNIKIYQEIISYLKF